jgi:hypothetical protein
MRLKVFLSVGAVIAIALGIVALLFWVSPRISPIALERQFTWEGWLEESSLTDLTQKYWPVEARNYIDAKIDVISGNIGFIQVFTVPDRDLDRALSRWPKEVQILCPNDIEFFGSNLSCYSLVPKPGTYYVIVRNGWMPNFESNDVLVRVTIRYR